jgi:hypothetical protein
VTGVAGITVVVADLERSGRELGAQVRHIGV